MSNRTASAQPRILVVDDDRAMRDFFATSLRLAGFDVQTASDGIAALNEIDRRRPDVVVLDLDLPIMNGFTVHEALRMQDATCDLPIVVVSGTG
jgi:two-component system response regulator MprA